MNQREFTAKVKQDKQERVNKAKAIYDASEEGMFYKSYIGSPEHKRDIEVFGFGKVAEKIKPSYELRKKLELEYNINYLPA